MSKLGGGRTKVKCIKENGIFAKLGEVFEVEKETSYGYILNTEFGKLLVWKSDFEIIKEDKMEEIRVVGKLEDLHNLENGMGLKVVYENDKERVVTRLIKGHKTAIGWFTSNDVANFGLDYILDVIKSMGFKFDYKPSGRSLEEVINEIKSTESLEFDINGNNFFIANSHGKYYVENHNSIDILGATYMTKETAQKYARELNEIINSK